MGLILGHRYELIGGGEPQPSPDLLPATDVWTGQDVSVLSVALPPDLQTDERVAVAKSALLALHHPNIVRTFDILVEGNTAYVVTEAIGGPSLAATVATGTPSLAATRAWFESLLEGLVYAHANGVVHGDVRATNVYPVELGVKVADFASSILWGANAERPRRLSAGRPYTAPELASGEVPNPRTDIYLVGALLYGILTGLTVSDAVDQEEYLRIAVFRNFLEEETAPSSVTSNIPPEWDAVVLRAIALDPAARFTSAQEMLDVVRTLPVASAHEHVNGRTAGDPETVLGGWYDQVGETASSGQAEGGDGLPPADSGSRAIEPGTLARDDFTWPDEVAPEPEPRHVLRRFLWGAIVVLLLVGGAAWYLAAHTRHHRVVVPRATATPARHLALFLQGRHTGSTYANGQVVTLSWTRLPTVKQYRLQVSRTRGRGQSAHAFDHIFLTTVTTGTSYRLRVLGKQHYWWRLQTRDARGWHASPLYGRFYVGIPRLTPPGRLSPRGRIGLARVTSLCWSPVPGADGYELRLNGRLNPLSGAASCTRLRLARGRYIWTVAALVHGVRIYRGRYAVGANLTITGSVQHSTHRTAASIPPSPAPTSAPQQASIAPVAAPAPTAVPVQQAPVQEAPVQQAPVQQPAAASTAAAPASASNCIPFVNC